MKDAIIETRLSSLLTRKPGTGAAIASLLFVCAAALATDCYTDDNLDKACKNCEAPIRGEYCYPTLVDIANDDITVAYIAEVGLKHARPAYPICHWEWYGLNEFTNECNVHMICEVEWQSTAADGLFCQQESGGHN